MSLVDKLEGVHIGDIIVLRNKQDRLEVAGYIQEYTSRKVKLSTTNPFNDVEDMRFWDIGNTYPCRTYNLEYFDDYEVLRKHT